MIKYKTAKNKFLKQYIYIYFKNINTCFQEIYCIFNYIYFSFANGKLSFKHAPHLILLDLCIKQVKKKSQWAKKKKLQNIYFLKTSVIILYNVSSEVRYFFLQKIRQILIRK